MDPLDRYTQRLADRRATLAALSRRDDRLGTLRLGLAAGFLGVLWASSAHRVDAAWLLVPAGLFALAVAWHRRLRTARQRAQRAVDFYDAAIARLRGVAGAAGPPGERFIDLHHRYGADLDLFGSRGLFAKLCTARTSMGEDCLAGWLLEPSPLEALRDRKSGIIELRERLDLREALATLGREPRLALRSDLLLHWAKAPVSLPGWLAAAASALTAGALASGLVWAVWGWSFPFLAVLVIEAAVTYRLRGRIDQAVIGIEQAYAALELLPQLLRRIEAEHFEAPPLRDLRARLVSGGRTASATLASLATRVNFIEARRNPFLGPLLLPLMYAAHAALAAERWRERHGAAVGDWLAALGEIEALQSMAAYSFDRPSHPFPEFVDGAAAFIASGLGHPLIDPEHRVCNDIALGGAARMLIVSGSNMSGKSTLLRSVGINAVLAMAGAPVCARQLTLTPLWVGASIRLNDSLDEGSSRFYAEITRLRQLLEPGRLPLLFLIDELLQGTNAVDRRIGARGVVKALLGRDAIGLIATHDMSFLEESGGGLEGLAHGHFHDELEDGRLSFDFKLRGGTATRSNGLELMRAIGLDV